MTNPRQPMVEYFQAESRLNIAIGALDAVRDLCCEAGKNPNDPCMGQVSADNLGCLLALIVDEMRSALNAATAART